MNNQLPERTYAEISLPCLVHNMGIIKQKLAFDSKIMTVLKADAYGHGAAPCAAACEPYTDYFAVASFQEAMQLRESGIKKDILLFGNLPRQFISEAAAHNITVNIYSLEYAQQLDHALSKEHQSLKVHIKIDSGLNRTGFYYREHNSETCVKELRQVYTLKHLIVTGIYTHFACAGSRDEGDIQFSLGQYERFLSVCGTLTELGYDVGLRHCCSSDGLVAYPERRLDMVRCGMLTFGQCSYEKDRVELGLLPALTWRAQIIQIKEIEAGESISYGRIYKTDRKTKIAIIAAGYADGYRRAYSNQTSVLIHGIPSPVRGRICMDSMIADITGRDDIQAGHWATLLGEDGAAVIAPNVLSEFGSVNGEVTAAISPRVERIYISL